MKENNKIIAIKRKLTLKLTIAILLISKFVQRAMCHTGPPQNGKDVKISNGDRVVIAGWVLTMN